LPKKISSSNPQKNVADQRSSGGGKRLPQRKSFSVESLPSVEEIEATVIAQVRADRASVFEEFLAFSGELGLAGCVS
jgi:hypothetical protein